LGAVSASTTNLNSWCFENIQRYEFGGYIADSFDDKKLGIFVIEICI
jgi:hypothetical protein